MPTRASRNRHRAGLSVEQLSKERYALLQENIFGFIYNTLVDAWAFDGT
jgi:hypothetical protein